MITIDSFKPVLYSYGYSELTPLQASKLQLALLDDLSQDECDSFFMKFLSRFITPEVYEELIQERIINKKCGYAMCSNPPARIKDNFSKSFKESKLLPYNYLNSYCSKLCFQKSEIYKAQLSSEALFARKDVCLKNYGSMKYETNVKLLDEILKEKDSASIADVLVKLDELDISGDEKMVGVDNGIKIVEKFPSFP